MNIYQFVCAAVELTQQFVLLPFVQHLPASASKASIGFSSLGQCQQFHRLLDGRLLCELDGDDSDEPKSKRKVHNKLECDSVAKLAKAIKSSSRQKAAPTERERELFREPILIVPISVVAI